MRLARSKSVATARDVGFVGWAERSEAQHSIGYL